MPSESAVPDLVDGLLNRAERVVVGQRDSLELVTLALVCGGHILLEGVPGTAKTLMARTVARLLALDCKRVQFTPDLMPSDILGTNVFNLQSSRFEFRPGPVFTDILVADEINRTPPKTQSALLEVMEEKTVTLDGVSHGLSEVFTVMATQNPIEYEGTFRLPEAQLDRFMMNISIGYPKASDEMNILESEKHHHPLDDLSQIMTADELVRIQQQVRNIHVDPSIQEYIVGIASMTRNHANIYLGASPRGSLAMFRASQALAAIRGRGYVIPDDVKLLARPTLAHRIIVTPAARVRNITSTAILEEILQNVPVPGAWVGGGKGR